MRTDRGARAAVIVGAALLSLGAQCGGGPLLLGPFVRQQQWVRVDKPLRLVFSRPDRDFRTATITVRATGVRFAQCEGTPLPTEKENEITVHETCVEAIFDKPVGKSGAEPVQVEVRTDLGHTVVVQRAPVAADGPLPQSVKDAKQLGEKSLAVGIEGQRWQTWAMELDPDLHLRPPPKVVTEEEKQALRCELVATSKQYVVTSSLTPGAEYLALLRDGGCVETWDVAKKTRIAALRTNAKESWDFGVIGAVVVLQGKTARSIPALEPAALPVEKESNVMFENGSIGVRDLATDLEPKLAEWAKKQKVTLRKEGNRTWLTPPKSPAGEALSLNMTADGKLVAMEGTLWRIDTGKTKSFQSWTKGFTAMSDETFDGTLSISLGPRSDRAVVVSQARMGAGPEVSSAVLIDTTTMKSITNLATSCQPHMLIWSPGGTWVVRRPCDGGVLPSNFPVTRVDTGKPGPEVSSMYLYFAADDMQVAARETVVNLATGQVLLEVPAPASID